MPCSYKYQTQKQYYKKYIDKENPIIRLIEIEPKSLIFFSEVLEKRQYESCINKVFDADVAAKGWLEGELS